jgi:hypothetical protein
MKNEKQYTAKDNISSECYRGTREQWAAYLRDTPWYSDYEQTHYLNNDDGDPITESEWIEMTLDENLIEWDEEDQSEFEELDY